MSAAPQNGTLPPAMAAKPPAPPAPNPQIIMQFLATRPDLMRMIMAEMQKSKPAAPPNPVPPPGIQQPMK